MHEQRLIVRLQNYWEMLKKDKEMPQIEHFNCHALPDIWPKCVQISLDYNNPSTSTYKYDYMGVEAVEMLGHDMTGHTVDKRGSESHGFKLAKHIELVMQTHQPQKDENQFSNKRGELIKYRCCFLPFGDVKKGLTHIIVGLSHRVYR
jgi:hypothetical protein